MAMDNLYGMGIVMDYLDNNATNGLTLLGEAFDSARRSGRDFVSESEQVNQAISGLGQMAATLTGVGIALTAAGSKAIETVTGFREAAKSYESELATLKFATQATGEEWDLLVAKAEKSGLETQFSPEEAVQGLYELTSMGLTNMQAIASLSATLDFSTMSNGAVSVADSASVIASTINKFNLSATEEQVEHIADVLATASRVSAFKPEDVSSFINSIGSMPASLGVTLEEVMSLGSLLVNIGQGSAQAGATVQGFGRKIKQLSAQMKSGNMKGTKASALEVLGIDESTFWDAEGQLRSMVDIFQDIMASTANLSQEDKLTAMQTVFGDQANNLLTALELSESAFMIYDESLGKYVEDPNASAKNSLEDIINGFKECNGVVSDGAELMRNTAEGMEELANGAVQTLQIKLGEATPAFDVFFSKIKYKVSSALAELIDKNPAIAKIATTIVAFGGGLLKIAGVASLAVAGVIGLALGFFALSKNLVAIKSGLVAFTGFLKGLPAMLSGVGTAFKGLLVKMLPLALIAGAVYLAWKTDFLGIKTIVTGFVTNLKNSFSTARSLAQGGVSDFLSETRRLEESGKWWDWLALKIMDFMLFFQGLSDAWADNTLSDEMFIKLEERGLLPLIEKFLDLKAAGEQVWGGLTEGFETIAGVASTAFSAIASVLDPVLIAFGELFSFDFKGLGSLFSSGVDLDFWRTLGKIIAWVVSILGAYRIAVTAVRVAMIAWNAVQTISNVLQGIYNGLMIALQSLPIVLLIAAIVAAIVALVYGIVKLIQNWDKVVEAMKNGWEKIKGWFSGVAEWFKTNVIDPVVGFFTGAWESIKSVFSTVANWVYSKVIEPVVNFVKTYILPIIMKIVEIHVKVFEIIYALVSAAVRWIYDNVISPIIDFFKGLWDSLVSIVHSIVTAVTGFFSDCWNGIKSVWSSVTGWFSNVWRGVKNVFAPVKNFFSDVFKKAYDGITSVFGKITSFFSGIWDAIKRIFSNVGTAIGNAITNTVKSAVNGVLNIACKIINGFISAINSAISIVNKIPGVSISKITPLSLPALATGTDNWQGGVAQISEKGGEIVDLPAGSRVYPHDETVQKAYADGANSAVSSLVAKIDRLVDTLARMSTSNGGSANSVVFEAGSIIAKVDNASVEDLEGLVDKLVDIIRRKQEIESIRSYA